jgi:PAS domain S-box-containing protein
MNRLSRWYKDLKLSNRVILSMNLAILFSILLISVFATLNRVRVQKKEATELVKNEIAQIVTLFDFSTDRRIEDFGNVIKAKSLYNSGFISVIRSDGDVVVCNRREGQNISGTEYFRQIRSRTRGESNYTDPVTGQVNYQFFEFYPPRDVYLVVTLEKREFLTKPIRNTQKILLFALIFTLIAFSLVNYFIMKTISRPIVGLKKVVGKLSKGDLPEKYEYNHKDEVGQMAGSVNELVDGLRNTAEFAQEIGKNNFNHQFKPLSEKDVLGNSLLEMRESLKSASDEEKTRKIEDEKRNWTTQGLARFGDILRQNNDSMKELSYNIINNLVDYLGINQGGIFIYVEEDESRNGDYLELSACFAFDRRKYVQRKILVGEGLVGTCFLEKETIYMTQIPQDYIKITSGLGDENPGSLLLVPLKLNEKVYGVVELASFEPFEKYKIEFVERIGESIASTISSVKINSQTALLLQKSQQQAEEMKAQEEEMRQNMEELTATQEAMADKERENIQTIDRLQQESKIKQETIVEKENELLDTLDNCPVITVRFNQAGKILFLNKAAIEFWGYNKDEMEGKNIHILFAGDFKFETKEYIKKQFEVKLKVKSGNTIIAKMLTVTAKFDDEKLHTGFFSIITPDVSELMDQPVKPETTSTTSKETISPASSVSKSSGKKPTQESSAKKSTLEDLHKSEESDTQKAWSQHMDMKGKQFKRGRKK